MKYLKKCPICNNDFRTYRENQQTCSRKCMVIHLTGENNPNYGNKWSNEQRKHLSELKKNDNSLSDRVKADWENNPERRKKAAETMSKTIKELFISTPELWNRPHTAESKIKIGNTSSAKFTPDFKAKQRKTMEKLGYWRTKDELGAYEIYFKQTEWIKPMWDLVENSLLRTHGVFNKQTNTKGCVRDHMFGRREGYRLSVPPVLLRHPANCHIILHSDNVKKSHSGDVSKTLEELIRDIKNYTKDWEEQEECLKQITQYLED